MDTKYNYVSMGSSASVNSIMPLPYSSQAAEIERLLKLVEQQRAEIDRVTGIAGVATMMAANPPITRRFWDRFRS